jgi:hypothetical protein
MFRCSVNMKVNVVDLPKFLQAFCVQLQYGNMTAPDISQLLSTSFILLLLLLLLLLYYRHCRRHYHRQQHPNQYWYFKIIKTK